MASVTVIVWEIVDSYDSPFDSQGYADGNFIHCILDDVALTLSVQIRSSSQIGGGTLIASPSDGPGLFQDGGISSNNFPGTPTPQPFWSRCDGTTLQRISPNNQFPYASLGSTPNSSQCQITPVCDLTISDAYSVTAASGPSDADGSVTISATSSNGTIRFSLNENFEYATGQTSGTFSNLLPGSYTIYAKDPIGCTDEINITIPITTVYGVKYRFEYALDTSGNVPQASRIDIEERAYSDQVIGPDDKCLGMPPFVLTCIGDDNDKYHPVWYHNARLNLISQSNGQWQELFSNDDQKYKVSHYRFESGNWVLKYQGFIVPAFYSEPYLNPPFYTTIDITDNIGNLKNEKFLDDDGNQLFGKVSLIFIVAMILRKTHLNFSIRCAIDILEESMDSTADDDVLAQAYIDTRIFYSEKGDPDNCEEVLTKILEPFGAFIKSALGYFWIIRRENSVGDIDYRQFDSNGDFENSGTFESLRELVNANNLGNTFNQKFIWRDASQFLEYQKNYGEFAINNDLMPDNNLIDSGSFELQYITETGGQTGFIDWNVFIAQAGLRYGFESVKNGDSKGAFYFDLENANAPQADNILYSKKLRVFSSLFDFGFDYWIEPEFNNFPFVRIAYQIKAEPVSGGTTLYLDSLGRWDGGGTAHKVEIFVTSYRSWQKLSIRIPAFLSVDSAGYDITISLYSHNHYGADASDTDFSDMRDIATVGQYTLGKRIYYNDETAGVLRAYTLKQSFESESTPDRVRPSDYSSPSNQKVWFLDASLDVGPNQSFVRKVLIDNVVFTQLVLVLTPTTYYSDAPTPIVYSVITDAFNVLKFEKEITIGDAPTDPGALQATIPNPEVYRAWLRLSDGTATENWARIGVTESKFLLGILLTDYATQIRDPMKKLSGNLLGNGFLSPINSLTDSDQDDKNYCILGYELDDRANSCHVVLAEMNVGAGGTIPDDSEFTEEFTTEFVA